MPSRTTCAPFTLDHLESRTLLASVPAGFTDTQVVQGFYNPTSMAFAPDGRVFVTEQPGRLRVVKNNQLLTTPAVTLNVSFVGERGLLGVAVDPNFATNNYVYLYYTAATGTLQNRVSRFTFSGDTIVPGSETTILNLDPLLTDSIVHNAGAMHFGPDGKLYITTGENGVPQQAQSLSNTHGKVLRINPDGSIPTDNPFYNTLTGNNRAIYAYGLRNPFTFAIQPITGRIFANDVGQERVEEVNDIIAGGNYGWPEVEGPGTNPAFVNPITSYLHSDGNGTAIAGGAFYNPTQANFPTAMVGHYFFGDYTGGWIRKLDPNTRFVETFATNIQNLINVAVAPDGSLMYLSRGYEYSNTGILSKVTYDSQSNQPPAIAQQPASITVRPGEQARFGVTATGSLPISYQWYRNGSLIVGATSSSYAIGSAQASDSGATFTVRITNNFGQVTSNAATLTVQDVGVTAPVITQQPADQSGAIGQTVTFSIQASGGSLSYQWYRNGQAVPGATSSTWSKTIVAADNSMAVQCYVSNSAGEVRSLWVKLNLVGSPTINPPVIVQAPANATASIDTTAYFAVQATSSVAMTYQWLRNGQPIVGATAAAYNHFVQASDNGAQFSVVVTNSAGSVTSAAATLTVQSTSAPAITGQPASTTVAPGATVSFSVTATGTAPLSYQWYRNGTLINGATAATYSFVAQVADNTARYTVRVSNSAGSVTSGEAVLTVSSTATSAPVITQQPTDQSAAVGQTATFAIAANGGGLSYQWYRNGQPVTGATSSAWTFTATAGDKDMAVQCRVQNGLGTTWSNWTKLNLVTTVALPVITQNPGPVSVNVGSPATFSVSAVGVGLTYQWRRNNVAIPGATSATYTFTPTLADNDATYLVIVTNSAGSVSSQPATLNVLDPNANQAPAATITSPALNATYRASNTYTFSGTAIDPEDGELPASAFSWAIIFHHDTHTHPFLGPIDGVKSGTFTVPNIGHTETNVWYRIRLTVTDSAGKITMVTRDVHPQLINLNLQTGVPGLTLRLDGQPVTTPYATQSVIGVIRTLSAPTSQVLNGITYNFTGWSDGQPWADRTLYPYGNLTFIANYSPA